MKSKVRLLPQVAVGLGIAAASAAALFSEVSVGDAGSIRPEVMLNESLRENTLHEAALSQVALNEVSTPGVRDLAVEFISRAQEAAAAEPSRQAAYQIDADRALRAPGGDMEGNYLNVLSRMHEQRAEICATAAAESWDPAIRGLAESGSRMVAADLTRIRQIAAERN